MNVLAVATFSLATLAAPLCAQTPVVVRCTPTDGSAAGCYYCPGYETVIKWNGAKMHCSNTSINLVAFHNLDVHIEGTWNGTVIEVTSIVADIESFSIGGGGVIGGRMDFDTVAPTGSLAANFLALGSAFVVPFDGLALQLDPSSATILGGGAVDGDGSFKTRIDLPDDASLIGLRVYGQGYVIPPVGAPYTTNLDTKVIG